MHLKEICRIMSNENSKFQTKNNRVNVSNENESWQFAPVIDNDAKSWILCSWLNWDMKDKRSMTLNPKDIEDMEHRIHSERATWNLRNKNSILRGFEVIVSKICQCSTIFFQHFDKIGQILNFLEQMFNVQKENDGKYLIFKRKIFNFI